MIKLNGITKKYRTGQNELIALDHIEMDIPEGDFVAIMGPSGSGKTTLLNIIGCMDFATEGEYYFNGRGIHNLKSRERDIFRKNNIGFIFQNFALLKDYTVKENVEIPLRAKGLSRKNRNVMVREILEKLGISEYERSLPTDISGGQQQRVAIARALVSCPKVILADEPTGALDSVTGNDIMTLLLRINEEDDKTVLLVTHDEKIASRAKRIIRIEEGMIADTSEP